MFREETTMTKCANVAAQIHANMCNDSGFGYSWGERYGVSWDKVTWNIDGRNYQVNRGDYDCSSSVCTAWQKALEGTAYEGALDGATYTGNMRSVFVNSGLFDVWNTYSTSAQRGDVYLNDNYHTAMCQDGGIDGVYGFDALSEFCINEFGGTYGGQRGDQTGGESRITDYYNYPWNCTLHYNGKADTDDNYIPADPAPIQTQPIYAVWTAEEGWLPTMEGLKDSSGSGDDYAGIYGLGIRYIGIEGVDKYRVCDKDNGWLPYVEYFNKEDEEYGMAGAGSSIVALEIPNSNIKYQVHTVNGEWLPWMIGNKDTSGSSDTYAGDLRNPIDAVRICKA